MEEKNKIKGFTLVELLATIVILGIIMVVAIPNVIGILEKNRATTYVEDAKKLAARAEYVIRSGKVKKLTTNDNCMIFNLAYLDNNEFENGPYGHPYDKSRSFVIAELVSGRYSYYVRLLEPLDDSDSPQYKGIVALDSEDLNAANANKFINSPIDINDKLYTLCLRNDYSSNDLCIPQGVNPTEFNFDRYYEVMKTNVGENNTAPLECKRLTPMIAVEGKAEITDADINAGANPIDVVDSSVSESLGNLSARVEGSYENLNVKDGSVNVIIKVTNNTKRDRSFVFGLNLNQLNLVVKDKKTGENLDGIITVEVGTKGREFELTISEKPGAKFDSAKQELYAFLIPQNMPNNVQNKSIDGFPLPLEVTYVPEYVDSLPPTVNNVKASKSMTEVGAINLTWDAVDDHDGIKHFNVYGYDASGVEKFKKEGVTSNSLKVTGLNTAAGASTYNYKFKVCGVDNGGHQATAMEFNNATTAAGPCSMSASQTYQWVFSVNGSIDYSKNNKNGTVDINKDYTFTFEPLKKGDYDWYKRLVEKDRVYPNDISVTMIGNANPNYTYNSSNGTVTIKNVTGNVTISGSCPEESSGCLIEGTKVLLKNGKKKKIEDVKFDDLVAVWNYDTGKVSYEYPIWLEKEQEISKYKVTVFSDDTALKTAVDHAVFSLDHNEFISVNDNEKYKVGTKVAKVINGKIKPVTIKKIYEVNMKAKYYQVVSTRYYNVIADDFLTTDYTVELSNAYNFDKNITWPKDRLEYINNPDNKYKYSDFEDILPHYLYYGLTRDGEGKKLERYGIGKEEFRNYFLSEPLKEGSYQEPETDVNGNNIWMVTTSLDKVTEKNKDKFKHVEGTYYTLPKNSNVKYYINSTDNKKYKPGDKVKVNCGIYFEAVKK